MKRLEDELGLFIKNHYEIAACFSEMDKEELFEDKSNLLRLVVKAWTNQGLYKYIG